MAGQHLVLTHVPTAPAFEAEAKPESAGRYFWRNRNIAAQLDVGGSIAFRFGDGRRLGITFLGAKPGVEPRGESASYPVSYYLGASRSWYNSTRWERVRYREIYPGIDLVLVTNAGQLEYTFEVRAKADPGKIRIRYRGAPVFINQEGDLIVGSGSHQLEQRRAVAFQGLESQTVQCRYRLAKNEVSLRLGRYDLHHALTIDPALIFSTYLGGPAFDAIYAVTADSAGNIYVTGETDSGSLTGGAEPTRSSYDAWVAKLNGSGSQLLYLAYLGGSGNDSGRGVAVDASGNAYVTGITASSDFPTTSGAFSTVFTGTQEAFVSKLSPTGQIQYSTYLGGGSDSGFAIAVDIADAVYIAGQTASVSFPVTTRTIQTSTGGGLSDCFVSKLNALGSSLVYSTYLGGSGLDLCAGIAIDASHDAYVTGTTYSTNFPTEGPLQGSLLGTATAFVAEINPSGSALLYSTYLGGSILDNGNAIAVDSSDAAYIAGSTASPDFPTTVGAVQAVLGGTYNAFVSKIAPAGASLSYSTFVGGSGVDDADAIAVDSLGEAVIGGYTSSPNFPVAGAIQATFQGVFDAFATVVNASGSSLVFSSYFGGSGDDRGFGVTVLPGESLALGGMTASTNFATAAALQSSFGGTYDGFALNVQYGGGLAFYALTPCRIADTREGFGFSGAFGPPSLVADADRSFPIPQSSCDVPATAQAYSLNITVLPQGPLGYLTLWPTGSAAPSISTMNAPTGIAAANAAIVSAGTNGAISLFASSETNVLIDINGYFAAPNALEALAFIPVTPCRIADTRTGFGFSGAFGPPSMVGGATRNFPVQQSPCGIPSTAQVYSARMTAIPPGPLGYLTTWPEEQTLPNVSTLNAPSGGVVGNEALVPAGTESGGPISVYVSSGTNLLIDINGYLVPTGTTGALSFYSLAPCRVADTRAAFGFSGAFGPPSLVGGATRTFPVQQSSCAIPSSAQAYSLNLTVVVPSGGSLGYLTAFPAGETLPNASTVNAPSGGVVGSAAIVPAGSSGAISVFASSATDVLIDINGYFAP
jgi:Beta-propeller repeat